MWKHSSGRFSPLRLKTSDPANMKKFLGIYLNADVNAFDAKRQNQEQQIVAIMRDDPFGAKEVPVGKLNKIDNADVRQSFEPVESAPPVNISPRR
jgi:hypothetical protein